MCIGVVEEKKKHFNEGTEWPMITYVAVCAQFNAGHVHGTVANGMSVMLSKSSEEFGLLHSASRQKRAELHIPMKRALLIYLRSAPDMTQMYITVQSDDGKTVLDFVPD